MRTNHSLNGITIIVLEDHFILAAEISVILEEAGARVLGPFHSAEEALRLLDDETPDCGLIGIDLGDGLDFRTARKLVAKDIPFALVTGHGSEMIPPDLRRLPRAVKPTFPADLLSAVKCALDRDC